MNATATQTRTVLDASDMKCRCANVVTASGETTGCTRTTTRTFAPGHDAKLKSLLGLALANNEMVTVTTPGDADGADATTVEVSALEAAGMFGNFGYMVVQIAEKVQAKRDRAEAHKAKLAANKAARAEKKATKAKPVAEVVEGPAKPEYVKAKVGRWEYKGVAEGEVFYFTKKDGTQGSTTAFALVDQA